MLMNIMNNIAQNVMYRRRHKSREILLSISHETFHGRMQRGFRDSFLQYFLISFQNPSYNVMEKIYTRITRECRKIAAIFFV